MNSPVRSFNFIYLFLGQSTFVFSTAESEFWEPRHAKSERVDHEAAFSLTSGMVPEPRATEFYLTGRAR